ncbi:MAG: hypothetical protein NZ455_06345 [Bacteroidia bacterium]|nr:hypothetical protein [Bacteroidia bacterium]MDW8346250.1 hypothetical protein [Bacteroidia bacterium]
MGVSLPTSRCARVGKVGVLRATLTLRCFAALSTAHAPSACLTHAAIKLNPLIQSLTL